MLQGSRSLLMEDLDIMDLHRLDADRRAGAAAQEARKTKRIGEC